MLIEYYFRIQNLPCIIPCVHETIQISILAIWKEVGSMSKKTRKRGLRHQDRVKAAQRNGGQKLLSLAQAGKTRKATGFPKDNRKKSQRKP